MQDFYSKKYNIRFYHAPKNSMTSMIKTLGLEWIDVNDFPTDIKTCAVIREPYDRFISSFLQTKHSILSYGPKNPHTYRYCKNAVNIFSGSVEEIAKNYIEELVNNNFFDNHQLTQDFYFNKQHERNSDNIDLYIDFSNLENELKENIDGDLTVLKLNVKSSKEKEIFNIVFTPYKEQIEELYSVDYKMYENFKKKHKRHI